MDAPTSVFEGCCQRFGWLPDEVITSLCEEAIERNITPLQIAIEDGLIDATKADIIRTLDGQTEPIPGYEIEDVVGIGGMGVVYRARQVNLNRAVALKTILKSCLQHPRAIERFEQEAMMLGQLQHPHIISAIDFGKQANRIYFVMEFVTGEDLAQFLSWRSDPFDEWATWELVKQTAQGLAYAAQHGIVHRDIKPANLILVPDETQSEDFPYHVKIADFGLARITEQAQDSGLTQEGMVVGSPRYMAPEQLERSKVTPNADIYALGATAYHMLTGIQPFDGLSVSEMIRQKLTDGLGPLQEFRADLSKDSLLLIDELLELNPDKRLSAATVVQRAERLQRRLLSNATIASTPTDFDMDETAIGPMATQQTEGEATEHFESHRKWTRPRFLWPVAVVLLVAIAAIAWPPSSKPSSPLTKKQLVPSGRTLPLFNGQQLGAWTPLAGNWLVPPNEPVISGTDGVLQHVFLRRGPEGKPWPVENYRLEMIFDCQQAAEVHFLLAVHKSDNAGLDLGIADDQVKLPEREPVPIDCSKPHALTIEHQADGWFINLDGNPLGAWPTQAGELPEVRIQVIGGPAWFSDIYLTELQEKPAAS